MSVKNTENEEQVDSSSVDSFIKELEEKEKDLDISSDLVIEVDDSDVEHDNIHDSFVSYVPETSEAAANSKIEVEAARAPAAKDDSQLLDRISKLTEERDMLKEALLRRTRDFDNHRNRTERERKEAFSKIVCNVAAQTLPVIDNLNRALDAFSDAEGNEKEKDFETFLEGIVLVNQQLNEVLSSMGVQPIPAIGQPFDPKFHEAVATEESAEHPPRTVILEILRGYKVDDRVIRASIVKVSSESSSKEKDSN